MVTSDTIDTKLVRFALEQIKSTDGSAFEDFCNDFLASIEGLKFSPSGGYGDGGVDAHQDKSNEKKFYQYSVTTDYMSKIKSTINRIKQTRSKINTLVYVTNQIVPQSDKLKEEIHDDFGVLLIIYDGNYIASHINDTQSTTQSYKTHLSKFTQILDSYSSINNEVNKETSFEAFAFVSMISKTPDKNLALADSIIDSLLLWALEKTDPDSNVFMNQEEIEHKICETIPSIGNIYGKKIRRRLDVLSKKKNGKHTINFYKKENVYVLPLATRNQIKQDSKRANKRKDIFIISLKKRVQNYVESNEKSDEIVNAVILALQKVLESQGAYFCSIFDLSIDRSNNNINISKIINSCILDNVINENQKNIVFEIIRDLFYGANEAEKEYLEYYSKTYTLLFTIKNEPKIIEYLNDTNQKLYLYFGADIILRSLSEYFLDESNRTFEHVITSSRQIGARCVLTEPIVKTILAHIVVCDNAYKKNYRQIDQFIRNELIDDIDHLFLRTYFRNKSLKKVQSWEQFVSLYVDYDKIYSPEGETQLQKYITSKYKFEYRTSDELQNMVDEDLLAKIKNNLLNIYDKDENTIIAENDALIASSVYAHRKKDRENNENFGASTWWVTTKKKVIHGTSEIIKDKGSQYIMHPDYLLNYISLVPKMEDVNKTYQNVFSTDLVYGLSRHLPKEQHEKVLKSLSEAVLLEPARLEAKIATAMNEIKGKLTSSNDSIFDLEEDR